MMSLPRSTPADQHVDPAAILRFLDVVDGRPDIEMHSLMVVRHGQVIAEGWWAPYSADRPQLLYSLSKSFTATAAAFAQAEGLFDLDDPVVSHFPEFEADITDPRSRAMKIRHVASMASGHTRETLGEALARDPGDLVRGFLLTPPEREPGTVFAYNQPCTYTLASIVQRHAGMPMTEYLRPRLFDPLGIGQVGWQARPAGRELGFTGLHARTEDIAKLGQLYLQRGKWDGVQMIPEAWVAAATSKQVDNPDGFELDWSQGYGFQFWMARHGYRGDGAFGQFCVVLPEHDTVVATTAYTWQMQAMLDAMWEHLLPALGTAAPENGPAAGEAERPARRAGPARLRGGRGARGLGGVGGRAVHRGRRRAGHGQGHRDRVRHRGPPHAHRRAGGAGRRRLADQPRRAVQRADPAGRQRDLGRVRPRRTAAATASRSPPPAAGSTTTPSAPRSSSSRPRTGWTSPALCPNAARPPSGATPR